MATSYKILGQAVSVAGSEVTLYTVPAGTDAVISSLTVANRDVNNTTFRIAVRQNGETLANKQYVAYDIPLDRNSTQALTLGITLNGGDVVTVRAASANVSFNAFGTEITS
jgi:hypothetical protein